MRTLTQILTVGLTLAASTQAFANDFGPLVLPNALFEATEKPVILDIRGKGYEQGHIAGALSAPYGLFRGPAANPGQVPDVAQLEVTYEKLGLEQSEPIVIVSQGNTDTDFGAAARVYWTLKSSGFTNLSVLNGGTDAWAKAGLPLSTDGATAVPSDLEIKWDNTWTVETEQVKKMATGMAAGTLIDARTPAFFVGKKAHKAAARSGTLPGAKNLPYTGFFSKGATALNATINASSLSDKLGVKAGEEIVSFCNTGHWAATNWFAMSEVAGIPNVKLYPASMVEYSKTDGVMKN